MLRLLLLTEDTGGDASAIQKALAEKMLRLIAADCAIERVISALETLRYPGSAT